MALTDKDAEGTVGAWMIFRAALDAIYNGDVQWEDYPNLGEHTFDRCIKAAELFCEKVLAEPNLVADYKECYEHLAAKADNGTD